MTKNQTFRIVAAGEHFGAVMRAQELSRRLAVKLEPKFEISSDAWKFEALGNPQVKKTAAERAANADMIIIAASGATEPPDDVKSWIESWLPQKCKGVTALVALLDHEDEALHESAPLCAYLRRMASQWGMDFFSNSGDWCRQHLESAAEAPSRRQEIRTLETSDDFNLNYAWRDCPLNG